MRPIRAWTTWLAVLWLLQAAALGFAAAVESGVGGYAYPRVSAVWAGPLPAALSQLSAVPGGANPAMVGMLSKLDLKNPADRQSMAPVIYALSHDLGITPERFRALKTPEEKASALAMAIEQAHDSLEAKVQLLAGQARDATWAVAPGDREAQAGLYHMIADLREIRRFYGVFLSEDAKTAVEKSYGLANARALEIREALIRQAGAGLEAKTEAVPERPQAPAVVLSAPSATAVDLLEKMRRSKADWGLKDFRTVYNGYGFVESEGGKHVRFIHPVYPELHATVSRGTSLAKGYAADAVKLIDRLEELRAANRPKEVVSAEAPREIPLEELQFLLAQPTVPVLSVKAAARKHGRKVAASRKTDVSGAVEPIMTLQPSTPREDAPKIEPPSPEPVKK